MLQLKSQFLCRLWSIVAHRDHFARRLSVRVSVCLLGSHTFLVVTHSYVSQSTHAFLGMLPLFFHINLILWHTLQQHLAPSLGPNWSINILNLDIITNFTKSSIFQLLPSWLFYQRKISHKYWEQENIVLVQFHKTMPSYPFKSQIHDV